MTLLGQAPDDVVVLAHGVGTRADLPVPLGLALTGAALAVLVSFGALGLLWPRSRLRGDAAGRPLPHAVQRVVDDPVLAWVLRLLVLAVTVLIVAVALVGPVEPPENLAVYGFYVTFWVGLVPASLLLGPVWRKVNPLRTLHRLLELLTGPAPAADRIERAGLWPATGFLLAYAWLELAYPDRSRPASVGLFLVLYGVVQLIASLWFGAGWFARGDAFEVYSTLVGRLSPFGRRDDGRLVLRNPLDGVDGTPRVPGLSGFVVVLVGTTAFDGVTRTQYWQNGPGLQGDTAVLPATLGLVVVVLAVAGLYAGATALAGRISGTGEGPPQFAHSVIPIAVGYAVAHYFSLLLLDGQLTWILASDPFQTGRDLFGTSTNAIDYTAVSPAAIAYVQVAAIVVGHVLGVVLAHDRAVRLSSGHAARTSQYPLLLVMVAFTVGGLYLLLG
ncbi:MAG: conserved rane protein of unknown function [Frankiales bacterium]|nr:conserved rane protein of unknown function [Frankiales bacterium]